MKNPRLSVIIPAYNAEEYIEKCLLSLKEQTFKDFEIVVVIDGSNDRTAEIASKYARVLYNEKNLGEGASRNKGSYAAQGEILVHTDADVVAPPRWLEGIVNNLKDKKVIAVAGGYCGSVGNSFIERFAHNELIYRRKDFDGFVNTVTSNNFACYRDVFIECGGFPEKFKCEDLRLSYEISKKYQILWDKNNCVFHHFRPSIKAYLRQQYLFGRDTVWVYYCYPELFMRRTHQGRSIYLETVLMFLALAGLVLYPVSAVVFLLLILVLNFGLLMFLKGNGLGVIRCFTLTLIRDVACVISVFVGMGLVLKDILKRLSPAKA